MTSTTLTAPRCHVALELSQAKWLVGVLLPGRAKVALYIVRGGDAEGLAALLNKVAARASAEARQAVSISVCFEIGYDGFWLARFLLARGIDTHVLDASSFLVSRRGRRAKTDRIDVEAMAFTLKAYLAGDRSVCRTVEVPTPEAEDAKRLSRERTQLTRERTRHVNRIRGLLTLHGIRAVKGLFGGAWREALDALVTGDGHALGPFLRAELAREFERLHLVLDHVRQLDAERRAATAAATAAQRQSR
jgi:transposase